MLLDSFLEGFYALSERLINLSNVNLILNHQTMKQNKTLKDFEKLADQYEGNLLNYFCGMTPKQSKAFNKMVRDAKKQKGAK